MTNAIVAKAVLILGSQSALAKAVGVKKQAVYSWMRREVNVPIKHCPSIERATNGEVTCAMLRPDFDWLTAGNSSAA